MSKFIKGSLACFKKKKTELFGPYIVQNIIDETAYLRSFSSFVIGESEQVCGLGSLLELKIDFLNWIKTRAKIFDENDYTIKSGEVIKIELSDNSPTFQYFENGWVANFKVTVITEQNDPVEGWYFEANKSVFAHDGYNLLAAKKPISFDQDSMYLHQKKWK